MLGKQTQKENPSLGSNHAERKKMYHKIHDKY